MHKIRKLINKVTQNEEDPESIKYIGTQEEVTEQQEQKKQTSQNSRKNQKNKQKHRRHEETEEHERGTCGRHSKRH